MFNILYDCSVVTNIFSLFDSFYDLRKQAISRPYLVVTPMEFSNTENHHLNIRLNISMSCGLGILYLVHTMVYQLGQFFLIYV